MQFEFFVHFVCLLRVLAWLLVCIRVFVHQMYGAVIISKVSAYTP